MPPPLPSRPPERPNANVRAVLHLVFVLGLLAFVLFMSRGWEDAEAPSEVPYSHFLLI